MKFASLVLFCTLCFCQNARAQDVYRTYHNARFGTLVRYPANLVAPQPESANGDGRKFVSRDGQIELTVYGFNNAMNRTATGEMNRAIRDWKRDTARLTYYKAGRDWFVLSGYLGADIFYEKTLLRRGVFHTLIWQYPKVLKKRLDASVSRSAASFFVEKRTQSQDPAVPRVQPTPVPTLRPTARPNSRYFKPRRRIVPRGY
ncbi:hypothetical protein B1R32_1127 [Abditibacterium utsteinense]|uniref:Secreted protein n=1 Tax=Abditibacterium utsteinense TaxID=1960156 RepID=A0A2S8SRA8_9BACT|nr:hypothetical protein [Abditibacterium utsteinense]PQV63352.1 hypothetical protein B1R32_1127 [Abditibacterium utsteinense]